MKMIHDGDDDDYDAHASCFFVFPLQSVLVLHNMHHTAFQVLPRLLSFFFHTHYTNTYAFQLLTIVFL